MIHVEQCKVCNSKFRNLIEEMHIKKMSPQKIFDYLQSLSGDDKNIVIRENINPSSIRRHMDRHFNVEDDIIIKDVKVKSSIDKSRDLYKQGVAVTIDKVNTVSYMIETALIKMEQVDKQLKLKEQHQFTIQYMNVIKGLIESLAKLTGDLKQEGTIDVNFFSNEVERFAEIVLITIRQIDKQLNLNGQLEFHFAIEFKKQWDAYKQRQQMIMNGQLPVNHGLKEFSINTFNDTNNDTNQ